jgi:hypothetical protein
MNRTSSIGLSLGLALCLDVPAFADEPRATAVVETQEAVFFQPIDFPDIVWFLPHSEEKMFPAEPQLPGQDYWRAAVVLKKVSLHDPGQLRPEWAGKTLKPYILRPDTECVLHKTPEMHFVFQEVKAKGHDISAANEAPVCQFSFKLQGLVGPATIADLEAKASDGKLIDKDLTLHLRQASTVPWAQVYAAVQDALGKQSSSLMTTDEAQAAVAKALASASLAAVRAAMTPAEKSDFLETVYEWLFIELPSPTSNDTEAMLVGTVPAGDLAYHDENLLFPL